MQADNLIFVPKAPPSDRKTISPLGEMQAVGGVVFLNPGAVLDIGS